LNNKQPIQKKKEKLVRANQISKNSSSYTEEIRSNAKRTKKTSSQGDQDKFDDVCFTFCSLSKNKKKCIKNRKDAEIVSSILIKRFTEYEIEQAILRTSTVTIENLLKKVAMEKKLPYNKQMLFCAKRELTNFLLKKDMS